MPRGSHEYSLHRTRSVKEQTTRVTCKRKRLLTANYKCKSGVRANGFAHSLHGNPQAQYNLLLSAACLVRVLNFISGGLLTYF